MASIDDARTAASSGADRIELNHALELGGLTPSLALMRAVRAAVDVPIVAMVRPRAAGFVYGDSDRQIMLADAELLIANGADGIVCGCLDEKGGIHTRFWSQLADVVADRELIFHRAFDLVQDSHRALDQLVEIGTTRILTSGGRRNAMQGAENLASWAQHAAGRIEILPASGVSADNIEQLVRLTGCDQVHGSFSRPCRDNAGMVAESEYRTTCAQKVGAARHALDRAGRG